MATAQWGPLLKDGYRVVYAVDIDGIPYTLGAREMWTTAGAAALATGASAPTTLHIYAAEAGETIDASGYSTMPDEENAAFGVWFRVTNGGSGRIATPAPFVSLYVPNGANDGDEYDLEFNEESCGTFAVDEWVLLVASIDNEDIYAYVDAVNPVAPSSVATSLLDGNFTLGHGDAVVEGYGGIAVEFLQPFYAPRPLTQLEISALNAAGPLHDVTEAIGDWPALALPILYQDDLDGTTVPNGGTGATHPLGFTGTPNATAIELEPYAERAISHALIIRPGMKIGQGCDREKGNASGRAVEFTLGRQQLADEGLGPLLFARPTLRANITSALTSGAETTITVDSTSGWSTSGGLYIGREYCTYTGTTSTTFTGVTRGVAGYPHYHTATSFGAYAQCTDTPVFWRGRLVTLWAHLVGPDGRYLGTNWCELGDYCEQEWRGFVRDVPRPSNDGITLTCLPLPRLAAMEVGAEAQGVVRNGYIVSEAVDTITLRNPGLGTKEVPAFPLTTNGGIIDLVTWIAVATNHLLATTSWVASMRLDNANLVVRLPGDHSATTITVSAWFLTRGEYAGTPISFGDPAGGYIFRIPLAWSRIGIVTGAWIVVEMEPSHESVDAEIGSTGLLALDVAGGTEIAEYSAKRTSSDGLKIAFRLGRRNLFGSGPGDRNLDFYNPWLTDTKVRLISGASGSWNECLRTILTSSGTGTRGDYDTLPYGFGAGLPDDWIATDETDAFMITGGPPIDAVASEKTSVESTLCGWLALSRRCLVQRRQADGSVQLEAASTDIVDTTDTLTEADVTLDGQSAQSVIDAPNHIRIIASDALTDRPLHIVRDAARAQAEGVRALEVKAPGIDARRALQLGGEMLLMGDGQCASSMTLPPWHRIQICDMRDIVTAHPSQWDWATGTFAPESVLGRCVSHEKDLATQVQDVEFLLAGQSQERLYYAPTMRVVSVTSAMVCEVEDASDFAVGDAVFVYPVEDYGAADSSVIDSISGTTVTLTTDPGFTGTEIEITYDTYNNCTVAQRRRMFVRSDKAFR